MCRPAVWRRTVWCVCYSGVCEGELCGEGLYGVYVSVEPNFYSKNLMMLGKTYQRLGNKKLAMLYLTRAREFPINTPDDRDVSQYTLYTQPAHTHINTPDDRDVSQYTLYTQPAHTHINTPDDRDVSQYTLYTQPAHTHINMHTRTHTYTHTHTHTHTEQLGNRKLAMLYLTRAWEFPVNMPDEM